MIRAAIIGLGRWGRSLVTSVQGKSDDISFVRAHTRTRTYHRNGQASRPAHHPAGTRQRRVGTVFQVERARRAIRIDRRRKLG